MTQNVKKVFIHQWIVQHWVPRILWVTGSVFWHLLHSYHVNYCFHWWYERGCIVPLRLLEEIMCSLPFPKREFIHHYSFNLDWNVLHWYEWKAIARRFGMVTFCWITILRCAFVRGNGYIKEAMVASMSVYYTRSKSYFSSVFKKLDHEKELDQGVFVTMDFVMSEMRTASGLIRFTLHLKISARF